MITGSSFDVISRTGEPVVGLLSLPVIVGSQLSLAIDGLDVSRGTMSSSVAKADYSLNLLCQFDRYCGIGDADAANDDVYAEGGSYPLGQIDPNGNVSAATGWHNRHRAYLRWIIALRASMICGSRHIGRTRIFIPRASSITNPGSAYKGRGTIPWSAVPLSSG